MSSSWMSTRWNASGTLDATGNETNVARKRRKHLNRNWNEWRRHNPIIVIDNGTVRPFHIDDLQFFQSGRYPGLQRTTVKHVPEQIPDVLEFDDEVTLTHACA